MRTISRLSRRVLGQRTELPSGDELLSKNRYLVASAMLCLSFLPAVSASGDAATLKEIMQGLRNDFVRIGDGLLHDDFAEVAAGARGIAEHPRIPPDQVKRVATELGADMPEFKQMDKHVHDLSLRILSAAQSSDAEMALQSYLEMTEGCLACHSNYKERVAAILSEAENVQSKDSGN